jgi:hypothetical protein
VIRKGIGSWGISHGDSVRRDCSHEPPGEHDARIVDELLSQGVVRSTNNPVADYSQYLTARAFGLTLVASSSIGYDAIGEGDVRYRVTARRLTARNTSRQLGVEWPQGDRTCA